MNISGCNQTGICECGGSCDSINEKLRITGQLASVDGTKRTSAFHALKLLFPNAKAIRNANNNS